MAMQTEDLGRWSEEMAMQTEDLGRWREEMAMHTDVRTSFPGARLFWLIYCLLLLLLPSPVAAADASRRLASDGGAIASPVQVVHQRRLASSSLALSETAKLSASDTALGDSFGYAVAIAGNLVVVGADKDDDAGSNSDSGAAYVFRTLDDGATFFETAKLTAGDAAADDWFGIAVAISENLVVVGAYKDDDAAFGTGSAYVFRTLDDGATFSETAKLTASDAAKNDYFGAAVAIAGSLVVVGTGSSSTYVFRTLDNGATFSQTAKLTTGEPDNFGQVVAISGNLVVVGASTNDAAGITNSGAVYVFRTLDDGATFSQTAKLTASDAASGDYFGRKVAISGSLVVVGASPGSINSGAVYVFRTLDDGATFSQTAKLTADDAAAGMLYGVAVAIAGNMVVGGSPGPDLSSAYVFRTLDDGATFSQTAKLTAGDVAACDNFGCAVAIAGNVVVVGAYWDDDAGDQSGAAYAVALTDEVASPAPTPASTSTSIPTDVPTPSATAPSTQPPFSPTPSPTARTPQPSTQPTFAPTPSPTARTPQPTSSPTPAPTNSTTSEEEAAGGSGGSSSSSSPTATYGAVAGGVLALVCAVAVAWWKMRRDAAARGGSNSTSKSPSSEPTTNPISLGVDVEADGRGALTGDVVFSEPKTRPPMQRIDSDLRVLEGRVEAGWSVVDTNEVRALVEDLQKELQEYIEEASRLFQNKRELARVQRFIADQVADDKTVYEVCKKKADTEPCEDWAVIRAAKSKAAIQPAGDVAVLYEFGAKTLPLFADAMDRLTKSLPATAKVELKVAPLKHLYRIVEKTKFSRDFPDRADGVLDIVRCAFICADKQSMVAVYSAVSQDPALEVVRVKDRWTTPTTAGWADVMLNVTLVGDPSRHVCEIQIIHNNLMIARKGLAAHETYAKSRAAIETLEKLGFDSTPKRRFFKRG